jgi:hypothetical protein
MTVRLWLVAVALWACKKEPAKAPDVGVGSGTAVVTAPADAAVAPDAAEKAPELVPVTEPARRLWTHELADKAAFDAYSTLQGGEQFAKFVIDLRSDTIYYFDVDVYKVHKDFVFGELYKKPKTREAVRVFDRNYTENKVDFMLCYLVHHVSQDIWTFAFWDGDRATAAHVTRAYQKMKSTFFAGDKVKFRPDSPYQEAVAKKLVDVPVILNDQIYQAAHYVAFNQGEAVGTLRIVPPDATFEDLTFAPTEIVILTAPLPDITPVAGIISEQFSTPLSHVSLRARAWKIPNIGLREARTKHGALDGKVVHFVAKGTDYRITEATPEQIAAQSAKTKVTVTIPTADLAFTEMTPLSAIREAGVVQFGAKTANLGEIIFARLTGFEVPPGFGVPFHYYAEHVKPLGLDKLLAELPTDAAARKAKLAEMKAKVIAAPVSDDLRAKITAALAALPGSDGGVFVRSSGNAEDLADFNGAGLYDTVANQRGIDQVLDAIKRVWGSQWNFAAYEDRQRAGIDQTKVMSSVLVQVGVPATSAGVLLTEHPTDPLDEKNYTINAKSGLGMSVVDGKKVPESLIVSWYNRGIRILSRSAEDTMLVFDEKGGIREIPNPNKGKAVLTNAMAILLAESARKITKVFRNNHLDIEWVFVGDKLYIVQTRPIVR